MSKEPRRSENGNAILRRATVDTMGEALQWLIDLDEKLMRCTCQSDIDAVAKLQMKAIGKAKRSIMMAREDGFDFRKGNATVHKPKTVSLSSEEAQQALGSEDPIPVGRVDPRAMARRMAAEGQGVMNSAIALEMARAADLGKKH